VSFLHDDSEFPDLVRIVAAERDIALALVEKDYWVTHALWALHEQGFDVWLKGGTSLSKGFGLIERFSENLDLKVEPGRQVDMPRVASWKSDGRPATAQRQASAEWLASNLSVPGASLRLDVKASVESGWRGTHLHVLYPALHAPQLPPDMKPYVLLEVGSARVVPFVARDLTSLVHEYAVSASLLADYRDNRPRAVCCVHPLVTLLEKLDALGRRAGSADADAATYVRHYEDAAHIALGFDSLPPLSDHRAVRALANEMCLERHLRAMPTADDPAFDPARLPHAQAVLQAYEAIAPMFWGPRIAISEACDSIRGWIRTHLG
jgi:hypothetical protein